MIQSFRSGKGLLRLGTSRRSFESEVSQQNIADKFDVPEERDILDVFA
jgi:hypothetical protein